MKAFEVSLNGKRLCIAQIGEEGFASAQIGTIEVKKSRRMTLTVCGMDAIRNTFVSWLTHRRIKIGDEIRVKIIETEKVDQPKLVIPQLEAKPTTPKRSAKSGRTPRKQS
jgi:DNA-directed RNA polymerase subunit E'/Rpb7